MISEGSYDTNVCCIGCWKSSYIFIFTIKMQFLIAYAMHFRVWGLYYKDFSSLGVCSLAPPTLTLVLPRLQTWRSSSCSAWPSVTLWITACYSGSTALSLSILTVWVKENTNIAPVWLLQDELYLPNVIILLSWLRQSASRIKFVTVEKNETWSSETVIDVFVWTLVTTPFIVSPLWLRWKMVCLILLSRAVVQNFIFSNSYISEG